MNFFKEGKYFIKKNILLIILEMLILATFLVLINIFNSFNYNIDYFTENSRTNSNNKTLYSLSDTLYEQKDFSEFIDQRDKLQTIESFYDNLNNHDILNYLAINDQPLSVVNFNENKQFEYSYGTEMVGNGNYEALVDNKAYNFFDIKSMQMNQNTFIFYKLQTENGQEIDWNNINFESNSLPVILGAEYKGIYNIGDTIQVYYLKKFFDLEVIDFLDRNSFLFYKGGVQTYLDNYVIIPYPPELKMKNSSDVYYPQLYFEMINGDIVIDNDISITELAHYLDEISNKSGFKNYNLLGVSSFVLEYTNMFLILTKNRNLLIIIIITFLFTLIVLNIFIVHLSFNRCISNYHTYFLIGYSKCILRRLIKLEIIYPIILSNILFIYCVFVTNIMNVYSIFIGLSISSLIFIFSYIFIVNKTLSRYLK